jgi:hypothetical protein
VGDHLSCVDRERQDIRNEGKIETRRDPRRIIAPGDGARDQSDEWFQLLDDSRDGAGPRSWQEWVQGSMLGDDDPIYAFDSGKFAAYGRDVRTGDSNNDFTVYGIRKLPGGGDKLETYRPDPAVMVLADDEDGRGTHMSFCSFNQAIN